MVIRSLGSARCPLLSVGGVVALDLYALLGVSPVNMEAMQEVEGSAVVTHTETVETVDNDRVCTLLGDVDL
jgi:hypothetical protein